MQAGCPAATASPGNPSGLPWRSSPSRRYAGLVFFIQFKPPRSTGERYWNVVESWLGLLSLLTPIVLKLTGVITWSWWWVALSPIWISAALLVLLSPWWVNLARKREQGMTPPVSGRSEG